MMKKNILLLSSSRVGETAYLSHALPLIKDQLSVANVKHAVFIPFAGVTIDYQSYTDKVKTALADLNIEVTGIHQHTDPVVAIKQAQAVIVGGGNTFRLLERLYHFKLMDEIKHKVMHGMPYIGWSAGSNIAGLSIKTTNDMPIIEPPSFDALSFIHCQLNPHYTDFNPVGFNGETREQRLAEFMALNPETKIIAIEEGTALTITDNSMRLVMGASVNANGYLFAAGTKTKITTQDELLTLI